MSTITLTTAGYGDMVPTTRPSRYFTLLYGILGLGFFCGPVLDQVRKRDERRESS
jgi:hypothetical protein